MSDQQLHIQVVRIAHRGGTTDEHAYVVDDDDNVVGELRYVTSASLEIDAANRMSRLNVSLLVGHGSKSNLTVDLNG